ncbi:MAG TPA: hypothetical protein VF911_15025, partial [Thermoanaerobaculia bacterium]
SDDSNISPRLGATYDFFGDGRIRANASYSRYVSRIQEGIGGGAGGGNPSYFQYQYDGPQIGGIGTGLDSFEVLTELFKWFQGIGGTNNTSNLLGVTIPGLNTRFDGSLKSPYVDEFTLGLGTQIGARGFVRVDYIDREWGDFYSVSTAPHDQIENPIIAGQFLDIKTTENTNDLERTYHALQGQASYRLLDRLNLGASYTWSEARGNEVGENAGSGPVASAPNSYREYKAFARNNPVGFLPNDQTHRLRAWASYDQPLGFLGDLNVSVLQRFDSGVPYSAVQTINVTGNPLKGEVYVANPGYATPGNTQNYYFSDRGEFRTEDITATDLALNWTLPITRVNVFVQGELINVFNEQAIIAVNTSIRTFNTAATNRFNPFTTPHSEIRECPQSQAASTCAAQGYHWQKTASFGGPSTNGPASYQLPRTYRFSAGIRF